MSADWKEAHCGHCEYWFPGERPKALVKGKQGVLMDGPRQGQCRHGPASVIVVGQQMTPNGPGIVTQGMYPPVSDVNPACSHFAVALTLVNPDEPPW